MSGYAGYAKSNNAVNAEGQGRFPASVLAKKLGVPTAAIRALIEPDEWHHTSKKYNQTPYFDGAALLAAKAGAPTPEMLDDNESKICRTHNRYESPFVAAQELLAALASWRPSCWVCGEPAHVTSICPNATGMRRTPR